MPVVSAMDVVHCYQCNSSQSAVQNSTGGLVCAACGSEFVEKLESVHNETQLQAEEGAANTIRHAFTNPHGAQVAFQVTTGAPVLPAGGLSLENLLFPQSLIGGQGNSASRGLLHLASGESPLDFNWADAGAGQPLENILAQLADLHQPAFVATSRRVWQALPRCRVAAQQDAEALAGKCTQDGAANAVAAATGGYASCEAGEPCTVCHDEFSMGAEVVELPCRHCFHEGCLEPWLQTHNTCPVCRSQLPTDDLEGPQLHAAPRISRMPGLLTQLVRSQQVDPGGWPLDQPGAFIRQGRDAADARATRNPLVQLQMLTGRSRGGVAGYGDLGPLGANTDHQVQPGGGSTGSDSDDVPDLASGRDSIGDVSGAFHVSHAMLPGLQPGEDSQSSSDDTEEPAGLQGRESSRSLDDDASSSEEQMPRSAELRETVHPQAHSSAAGMQRLHAGSEADAEPTSRDAMVVVQPYILEAYVLDTENEDLQAVTAANMAQSESPSSRRAAPQRRSLRHWLWLAAVPPIALMLRGRRRG